VWPLRPPVALACAVNRTLIAMALVYSRGSP
jgi:hypothetical protein